VESDVMLAVGNTVKLLPLLLTPPTFTTTLPVVAPDGTVTAMLVSLQEVAVAVVPLNFTVLVPCVAPKLVPVIVTGAVTAPEVTERLVMLGDDEPVTVNVTPLLEVPPLDTTTGPVVAPAGTAAVIAVLVQFDVLAVTPLKVTLDVWPPEPKFDPLMVTELPIEPEFGLRVEIVCDAANVASSIVHARTNMRKWLN